MTSGIPTKVLKMSNLHKIKKVPSYWYAVGVKLSQKNTDEKLSNILGNDLQITVGNDHLEEKQALGNNNSEVHT